MTPELQSNCPVLSSSRTLARLCDTPKRNIGCAILVAAIEDYQSLEDQAHESAALFLFPTHSEYKTHYEWAVSMATGIDGAWLRESLDTAKKEWDRHRTERKLRAKFQTTLRSRLSA